MPSPIMKAKTAFLVVETDHTQVHYDAAYRELEKWNRWPIAESSEKADIVLYIGTQQGGTFMYHSANASVYGNTGQATGLDIPVTTSATCLTVFDRETKQALWGKCAGMKFLGSHEASSLIKDFRKRLEGK